MYVASNGIKTAVILEDRDPMNPRTDYDNLGKMICWHSRYNLGDKHNFDDSQEFAEDLCKLVKDKEVFDFLSTGECKHMRLKPSTEHEGEFDIQWRRDVHSSDRPEWECTGGRFKNDEQHTFVPGEDGESEREDILSFLTTGELLGLIKQSNEVAVLPLYLYDHSGLAMSTGSFVGRVPHAEWDSGCVGFTYMTKETALKELGIAGDKVNVAMILPESRREPILYKMQDGETRDQALARNGFQNVSPSNVYHFDNPTYGPPDETTLLTEEALRKGNVFKKDHTLYVCTDFSPDKGVIVEPAATFNPDIKRVTEENWKARAEEALESEVRTYDAFLQGEVYGYLAFVGLEEVDSCWGFNSGGEDIRKLFDDMVGFWGDDIRKAMMEASYESGNNFDIEEFFQNNDFPEFREQIRESVLAYLNKQGDAFPYTIPLEDLSNDKGGILSNVIEELYDLHEMPEDALIHETLQEHVGIAREFKPKLSVNDLEPGKDYTADELMAILNKKPSLMDQIAGADARKGSQAPFQEQSLRKER